VILHEAMWISRGDGAYVFVEVPALTAHYRIRNQLGAGAMGEVFLVENLAEQRLEALKVLKKVPASDARGEAHGRFKREVMAARRLAHQNIVKTYEYGELPDGRLFMTMEYVAGNSLAALLHQRGPLPLALTLGILAEVGDALHHAHAADVVHRDIKPANILLADHPHGKIVRIVDFGMAKILDTRIKENVELSRDGSVFGTPAYMAPEQCRSKPPDPRSDLYAAGCVAFELLTGEPPFRGSVPLVFASHIAAPPRAPSQLDSTIPPALDAIVLRLLEKAPERRFQTGADLCAAVQAVSGYRPLRSFNPLG
jgi:serine/threonine-protein kinase